MRVSQFVRILYFMSKRVLFKSITVPGWWKYSALVLGAVCQLAGQSPEAVSGFFEGKQVIVKLDMPGTQQGVDIYPQRPQALDLKSYSSRIKKFGTALRNGDSVMVTKVKVKDNNIEFQLGEAAMERSLMTRIRLFTTRPRTKADGKKTWKIS